MTRIPLLFRVLAWLLIKPRDGHDHGWAAKTLLKHAIRNHSARETMVWLKAATIRGQRRRNARPHVTLIGLGAQAPRRLGRHAAKWLKTADVVLFDRHTDQDLLNLAGDQADRVCLATPKMRPDQPDTRLERLLLAEARANRNVVCLSDFAQSEVDTVAQTLRRSGLLVEVLTQPKPRRKGVRASAALT